MNEKELAKLKNEYGFVPSSYKYVPTAYEIEKCIGQTVVLVTYERDQDKEKAEDNDGLGKWNTKTEPAVIISISDCDPITMTSEIQYKLIKDGKESDEVEKMRIQPEGYEFVNAEETGLFRRFQPFSLHHKMMEDELFFYRLQKLYEKRDTLGLESLKVISESKDQGQTLRYSHNIGAAIKLEDGSMIWIRLHTLRLRHRQGNTYGLFFSSEEKKEWSAMIHSDEKEYALGDWGKFKIIDLADIEIE